MKKLLLTLGLLTIATPATAWDGYDWQNSTYIEIEKGELVREGEDIDVYSWDGTGYNEYEVIDIDEGYSGTEIEVYDYRTGEYKTFDMD